MRWILRKLDWEVRKAAIQELISQKTCSLKAESAQTHEGGVMLWVGLCKRSAVVLCGRLVLFV